MPDCVVITDSLRNRCSRQNLIDPTDHSDTLACGQQPPCVNRSKSWMEHRIPDVSGITTLSGVTQVYGINWQIYQQFLIYNHMHDHFSLKLRIKSVVMFLVGLLLFFELKKNSFCFLILASFHWHIGDMYQYVMRLMTPKTQLMSMKS